MTQIFNFYLFKFDNILQKVLAKLFYMQAAEKSNWELAKERQLVWKLQATAAK